MDANLNMQEEYRALRGEIRSLTSGILQLVCYTLIAVGAIMGYILGSLVQQSLQVSIGVAFLVPLGIICPSFFFTVSHSISIIKIGTYIKKFIEPNLPGLRWETEVSSIQITIEELENATTPFFKKTTRYMGSFVLFCLRIFMGERLGSSHVGIIVLPLFMVYFILGISCFASAVRHEEAFRPVVYLLGVLALLFLVCVFLAFAVIDWRKIYELKWKK